MNKFKCPWMGNTVHTTQGLHCLQNKDLIEGKVIITTCNQHRLKKPLVGTKDHLQKHAQLLCAGIFFLRLTMLALLDLSKASTNLW